MKEMMRMKEKEKEMMKRAQGMGMEMRMGRSRTLRMMRQMTLVRGRVVFNPSRNKHRRSPMDRQLCPSRSYRLRRSKVLQLLSMVLQLLNVWTDKCENNCRRRLRSK